MCCLSKPRTLRLTRVGNGRLIAATVEADFRYKVKGQKELGT